MATTTTNFAWPIPQSTDLVKDGATAIASLGSAIDTTMAIKGKFQIGSTLTLTGASTFSWTSIPTTYKSLEIVIENFYFVSGASLDVRPNNNSGSVYQALRLYNDGATVATQQYGTTKLDTAAASWTATSGNAQYNVINITIPNYASTNSKLCSILATGLGSTGQNIATNSVTRFGDNNAVTSVYLIGSANFSGGSAKLYGVN